MATSYSNTSVVYRLMFYIWQTSQSIEGNYSNVTWELYLQNIGSTAYAYWTDAAIDQFDVTVNGQHVLNAHMQQISIRGGQTLKISSGTVKVPHNSDGTKSISYSFSRSKGLDPVGYAPGPLSGSGTYNLKTIPRATSPSISGSITLGSNATISLPRHSDSFTHKVTYKMAGQSSATTVSTNATTSATLNIPISIASLVPNSAYINGTVTVQTMNGSTVIGTRTLSISAAVPESIKPAITSLEISDATKSPDIHKIFGTFVQRHSVISAVGKAKGSYGSTIKSLTIIAENRAKTGTISTGSDGISTATMTMDSPVSSSGQIDVRLTATDSRGRSVTSTKTITIAPYDQPVISKFSVERSNGTTPSDNGKNALVHYSYSVNSLKGNTASFAIEVETLSSDGKTKTWVTKKTLTDLTGNGTFNLTDTFDESTSYNVRGVLKDAFGQTIATAIIHPGYTLINWGAGGKSIAFMQQSSNNGKFEVGMPAAFNQPTELNGTVTARNGIYLNGRITSSSDNYPGEILATNAAGKRRYVMYSAGSDGGVHDVGLYVYTDADGTTYKSFTFKTNGRFSCGGLDSTGTISAGANNINTSATFNGANASLSGTCTAKQYRATSKLTYIPTTGNPDLRFSAGTYVGTTGSNNSLNYFTNSVMQKLLGNDKNWGSGNTLLLVSNGDTNVTHNEYYAKYYTPSGFWSIMSGVANTAIRVNYLLIGFA